MLYVYSVNFFKWNKNFLTGFLDSHLINYPTPLNLSYFWSFGSLSGISLLIQLILGIFLSMHYAPHIDYAFSSVENIIRNVPNRWLLRYVHANGSSMFFFALYAYMFRGMYYGSFMGIRQLLWFSGVALYLLVMATAFIGYALPWEQMGYWGFTIKNPTLNRFYKLHFVLPFLIVGFTLIHLVLLHKTVSNNPLGVDIERSTVPFYPYFFYKDLFAFSCYLFLFVFIIFYYPNTLLNPDNYIPAGRVYTPPHFQPEWYFLPYYTTVRSVPNKPLGIALMISSIFVYFLLPVLNTSKIKSSNFLFLFFTGLFIILIYLNIKITSCENTHPSPGAFWEHTVSSPKKTFPRSSMLLYQQCLQDKVVPPVDCYFRALNDHEVRNFLKNEHEIKYTLKEKYIPLKINYTTWRIFHDLLKIVVMNHQNDLKTNLDDSLFKVLNNVIRSEKDPFMDFVINIIKTHYFFEDSFTDKTEEEVLRFIAERGLCRSFLEDLKSLAASYDGSSPTHKQLKAFFKSELLALKKVYSVKP